MLDIKTSSLEGNVEAEIKGKKKKEQQKQKTQHIKIQYREWAEKGNNNLVAIKIRHGDCVWMFTLQLTNNV